MIADDLTTDGSHDPWCTLAFSQEPWLNASVWVGFDPTLQSYCQLDNNGEYSLVHRTNEFCNDASWNIIKGEWSYNHIDCSLKNTNQEKGNSVWFGSADGETPFSQYCHESFRVSLIFAMHSGDGKAGLLFRTGKLSTTWDSGPSYLVRVKASNDRIQIGSIENEFWDYRKLEADSIDLNTMNNLTLVADANLYDIYLNGELVQGDYNMSNLTRYTNYSYLGIGIHSHQTITTFYSLTYEPVTPGPTTNPTLLPSTFSPSANPTDVPSTASTNVPSMNPTHDPTPDTTTNPSSNPTRNATPEPTRDPTGVPTLHPTAEPTLNPTEEPTSDPTSAPSNAPSMSPTRYPIRYSDFVHKVTALFQITGWTFPQLSFVNNHLQNSFSNITHAVHQGFDADSYLEFQHIVLNISLINGHTLDDLMDGTSSDTILLPSTDDGMALQYLIECANIFWCEHIIDNQTFNRSSFEEFVTQKLNEYFTSTDASTWALDFIVEDITRYTMTESASKTDDESSPIAFYVLIVGGIICLCVSIVSLCIIIRHFVGKRRKSDKSTPDNNSNVSKTQQKEEMEQDPDSCRHRPHVSNQLSTTNISISDCGEGEGQEGVEMTGQPSIPMDSVGTLSLDNLRNLPEEKE